VVGFDGAATTVTVAAGEEAEVPHGLDGGGTATAAVVAGGTGLLSGVKRGYRDPDAADRSPVFNGRGATGFPVFCDRGATEGEIVPSPLRRDASTRYRKVSSSRPATGSSSGSTRPPLSSCIDMGSENGTSASTAAASSVDTRASEGTHTVEVVPDSSLTNT
jgi:hypothetical protein